MMCSEHSLKIMGILDTYWWSENWISHIQKKRPNFVGQGKKRNVDESTRLQELI